MDYLHPRRGDSSVSIRKSGGQTLAGTVDNGRRDDQSAQDLHRFGQAAAGIRRRDQVGLDLHGEEHREAGRLNVAADRQAGPGPQQHPGRLPGHQAFDLVQIHIPIRGIAWDPQLPELEGDENPPVGQVEVERQAPGISLPQQPGLGR